MLRIFRGERHVEAAAQPGQQEQEAAPGAGIDVAEGAATPPSSAGNGQEPGAQEPGRPQPAAPEPTAPEATAQQPGFLDRGRMRRRARFLRAARELAYRDLGGLVFDLHRFGGRNDEVVTAKLDTLSRIDSELRILEVALRERTPVTVLRQAGVTACPRCAAIHGSGDRFCPACGLAVDQAERPIAGPNAPAPQPPSPAWRPPSTAWQSSISAWQPPGAAAPPPIPGSPAQASPAPAPAHPPWTPNASPPPAAPAPSGRASPGAPTAPTNPTAPASPAAPTNPAAPTDPAAPTSLPSADAPPESQTEVIRSESPHRAPQQPTIAFDPLSRRRPRAADADRAPGDERDRERP